jgi:hypothetical protein
MAKSSSSKPSTLSVKAQASHMLPRRSPRLVKNTSNVNGVPESLNNFGAPLKYMYILDVSVSIAYHASYQDDTISSGIYHF